MKILFIIITAVFFTLYSQDGPSKSSTENEYVRVSITVKQQTMAGGDSGEVLINFKPEDKYFINMEPPPSVKFDSNKIVASIGNIQLPKAKKPEYVNTSQPVILPITLRKDVKKGTHELKGTLTYFFCSDEDGWCSKFKQSFALKIKVK